MRTFLPSLGEGFVHGYDKAKAIRLKDRFRSQLLFLLKGVSTNQSENSLLLYLTWYAHMQGMPYLIDTYVLAAAKKV